jgi:hypothetical protein
MKRQIKNKKLTKAKKVKNTNTTTPPINKNDKIKKIIALVIVIIVIVISAWLIRKYINEGEVSDKPVEKMKLVSVPDDFCVSRSCIPSEIHDGNEPVPLTGAPNGLNDVLMRKVKTMGALEVSHSGTPGIITVNSNFGLTDNHVKELINTAHSLSNVPKHKILLDYRVEDKLGHLRILQSTDTVHKFSGRTKPVGPNVIMAYGKQEGLDCPICNI